MFFRLLAASASMQAVDQLMLAAIPLIAFSAGAEPKTVGFVVAAQSAAWLVVSLPAGALADRFSRRAMLIAGAVATILGSLAGIAALQVIDAGFAPLALASFTTGAGVVIVILSVFALLPRAVERKALPRANARLELARAGVAFGAPAIAASLVARGASGAIFALAAGCGLAALVAARSLPRDEAAPAPAPMLFAIRDGGRFVLAHPALRAIALCAIFWNMGFFALAGLFAPFAAARLGFDAAAIGRCGSALGAGLILGALLAPALVARVNLAALLLFGPSVSGAAGFLIAFSSRAAPEPILWSAFFLLGFGPILWAIVQTSLRQTLTPAALMGRVGSTMQAANYGARPLGALMAGWLAAQAGIGAAIFLPCFLFLASLLAMAWLLRPALAAAPAS